MTDSTIKQPKIYMGPRGDEFKQLLFNLLERGKLKRNYIDSLLKDDGMKAYSYAFTAASADSVNNYERFEQLGDVTINKFIVWYSYKRFPQLNCTKGVKVVARLRINYGSKEIFAKIAEELGFWEYISAAEENVIEKSNMKCRNKNKKDLLEDTLEAFIGCTEYLLDNAYRTGVGYGVVYDLLSNIFDNIPISLKYEDLFDSKTRLKETFDNFTKLGTLGTLKFINSRTNDPANTYQFAISTVYEVPKGIDDRPMKNQNGEELPRKEWIKLGEGKSSGKNEAEQLASEVSLKILKDRGIYRNPPSEYEYFCTKQ